MVVREACPAWGSHRYPNNGPTRHGKHNHPCTACERQCMAPADDRRMADEQRTMRAHLRRERIALRGICHAVGVSLPWLLPCMVECCTTCPDDVDVRAPPRPTDVGLRQRDAYADARWSVGKKQAHTPWLWSALDAMTRPVMALHGGARSRARAKALWTTMPVVSREQAICHTEQ